jgi:hypothetical protein
MECRLLACVVIVDFASSVYMQIAYYATLDELVTRPEGGFEAYKPIYKIRSVFRRFLQ